MSSMIDILLPLPECCRNSDDMGMPPEDTNIKPKLPSAGVARWDVSIWADCPHCKDSVDICYDQYSDWQLSNDLELGEHGTELTKNMEVDCPECGKTFIVADLEW